MAGEDKKNIRTENQSDQSQEYANQAWFDVKDKDDADSLKAKQWETEERIAEDKSAHGNLHYGVETEQEYNKDSVAVDDILINPASSENDSKDHIIPELHNQQPDSNSAGEVDQQAFNQYYQNPESDPSGQARESEQPGAEFLSAGEQDEPVDFIAANRENYQPDETRQAEAQALSSEEESDAEPGLPDVTAQHDSQVDGTFAGTVNEDGVGTATGTLTISDVDSGDNPTFTAGDTAGTYGTLTLAEDGGWSYELDDASVQSLDDGDTATDTITLTASDGTQQAITITINGTEDAAVVGGTHTGTVTEDGADTVSGSLTISDVDSGDNPTFTAGDTAGTYGTLTLAEDGGWSYELNDASVQSLDDGDTATDTITLTASDGTQQAITITINGTEDAAVVGGTHTGTVTEDGAGTVSGSLTISDVDSGDNPTFTAGDTAGTYGTLTLAEDGTWSYELDDASVQSLDDGDTATDTITLTASDGTQQAITITINGTEDAAVVGGTHTGTVTEDGADTVSGSLTISDVDSGDNPTFTAGDTTGTYGTLTLAEDGGWSYELNDEVIQSMAAGDTATEVITLTASNGTQQAITITIHGTDDQPIFNVAGNSITELADDTVTDNIVTGNILANDIDVDNGSSFSVTGVCGITIFADNFNDGNADGWTEISYNNVDTERWVASDGIIGEKSNSARGIIAHDMGDNSDSNNYEISVDIHANTGNTYNNNVGVTFGYEDNNNYFMVKWDDYSTSYESSSTHKDFVLLKVEDGKTTIIDQIDQAELPDSFNLSVHVSVESGIIVKVDGVEKLAAENENPAISTIGLNTDDNDGGVSYDNVSVIDNDIILLENAATINGEYGTLTLNPDGSYAYKLNDANSDVQRLGNGNNLTETFTVNVMENQSGVKGTENLNITITGTNDGPVASDDNVVSVMETVFTDNFNDGNADGWTEISYNNVDTERWIASDGIIGEKSNSARGILAHDMGDNSDSNNYEISVDIHANTGNTYNNNVGVTFGYEDNNNYFMVKWDDYSTSYESSSTHKDFVLLKVEDGKTTIIDQIDQAELPDSFNLSVHVSVESGIIVKVDGVEKLAAENENPAISTIGLNTDDNDGGVSYDNVSVNIAKDNPITTTEDNALTIDPATLLGNDMDAEGDSLSITSVQDAANGSVILNDDGSITFNPEENYAGEASFTYTVDDGHGGTNTATVTLNVDPVNDAPVVTGVDLGATVEDTAVTFTADQLLASSSDVDGDDLSVVSVTVEPQYGAIADNGDGTYTFTPADDYNGNDLPINFTVSDGRATGSATASLDVTAVNDAPVAVDDTYSNITLDPENPGELSDGATGGIRVTGLYRPGSDENLLEGKPDLSTLSNHHYFDHSSLGHTGYNYMGGHDWFTDNNINIGGLRGGIITFEDGTKGIIDATSNGVERDRDGDGESDYFENAYIYYNAYAGEEDGLTTTEDNALTIDPATLLGNDMDVEGDSLSITSVQDAANGTVILNDDGSITFNPEENYAGEASFTYTVDDGHGGTDTATVTLNVDPVNDAVSIVSDSDNDNNIVLENAADGTEVHLTGLAVDVDGEAVTYALLDDLGNEITDGPFGIDPNSGVVTVNDTTQIDYETAASHDLNIQATSSDGTSSSQTFTVDIQDVELVRITDLAQSLPTIDSRVSPVPVEDSNNLNQFIVSDSDINSNDQAGEAMDAFVVSDSGQENEEIPAMDIIDDTGDDAATVEPEDVGLGAEDAAVPEDIQEPINLPDENVMA